MSRQGVVRGPWAGALRGAVGGGVLALAVAACSGPTETLEGAVQGDEERIEEGVEQMLEEEASEQGATFDLDLDGSAEIPEGWPDAVPVPDGQIVLAREQGGGYSLGAYIDTAEEAQAYIDALVAAGFTVVGQNESEAGGFWALAGQGLEVAVTWTDTEPMVLGIDVRPGA